jgi:hypothetical protein
MVMGYVMAIREAESLSLVARLIAHLPIVPAGIVICNIGLHFSEFLTDIANIREPSLSRLDQ